MNLFLKKYDFYPNKKEIGLNIKRYRKNLGITANSLADLMIYDVKTINKWEQGRSIPNSDNIVELAKIFNCKIDDLIIPNSKLNKDIEIDYQLNNGSCSYLFELFMFHFLSDNKNVFINALDYRRKEDYLLQKYIYSYLSKKEKLELECIIKYYYFFDMEKLEDIRLQILNNKITLDEGYFIIYNNYLKDNKYLISNIIMLFMYVYEFDKNNYEVFIDILNDIEKSYLLSFIINFKIKKLYKTCKDLACKGAKLNKLFLNNDFEEKDLRIDEEYRFHDTDIYEIYDGVDYLVNNNKYLYNISIFNKIFSNYLNENLSLKNYISYIGYIFELINNLTFKDLEDNIIDDNDVLKEIITCN